MWQLTVPGYFVAAIVIAGLHAAAAAAAPNGPSGVVGRPLAHTLVEALRFSFPFGGVPLASIAIAQTGGPLLIVARLGGAILLTWVGFQGGALLRHLAAAAVARSGDGWRLGSLPPGGRRLPAIAAAVLVAVVAVAAVAPRGTGTGRSIAVAVVQGGGEQGTTALEVPSRLVTERHLAATASIPADAGIDLVVWPENVVDVTEFATSAELGEITAEAARLDAPITVGVTEDVAGRPDRFTNAQVVVTPDGAIVARYDKVRRVPFGEYIPLRGLLETLGAPVDQIARDALAGTTPALLEVPSPDGAFGVAVAISWEIFFGGRVNEGVAAGGELVINPTNGASYTGTIVQTQQVASSRLRAMESGRWVVQAAPTGFSAFIGPDGTVHDRTAISEQRVIEATVELRHGRTIYSRVGDRAVVVAALVAFVAVSVHASPRRRRQADATAPATTPVVAP